MTTLRIEGDDLDDLLKEVVSIWSDEELDSIDIERVPGNATGIAYEPITIAAIITASTPVALALIGLIDRWLAREGHRKNLRLVLDAMRDTDPDACEALSKLATKYAEVEFITKRSN